MRRLVHLSDLHFGRVERELLWPLALRVRALQPHAVVVSGDLTQRARPQQFEEAKRFLESLPGPRIVVPGNHDVPLYNVFARFLRPLDRFRRLISNDLEPAYIDEEIAVLGVNTARSLVFRGGRINEEQLERVRRRLCKLGEHIVKVIVTHHPFDLPADGNARHIVGRARLAMETFARCGADLLLSGHLHRSQALHGGERYGLGPNAPLLVQAGTATSTRARGESNSFNALTIERGRVAIERYGWDPAKGDYMAAAQEVYERAEDGWKRCGA
jgi:3',5'-cyclic AMP phosphodiesterase CpdA